MLRFLLGISFCITLSACQTETLVKDVNISKKQELHNMNMNTYFAENAKKLNEVIQIPSEGIKSIDVYALYGFVESFSPISTAEQIKQRVGESLGHKDLFGTKSVHYRLEPKDFSRFFSNFNRIKSTLNPNDKVNSVYLILIEVKYNTHSVQILTREAAEGEAFLFSKIIKNNESFLILLDSKELKELFDTIDPNQNILK
ncbi:MULTISPECIES: hypothetical protein [Neisseriaceae]|uniref:Lipoprotein n=1 Tax=Morococcus cerebrosus TaxID=1056807 RepID=A0A0C1EAT7_9NEIS|nr:MULTISPECIES: hypothetical protein [Neisseriaceae]KIC05933.1 hypothetical protein MCC93_26010 [Morococcus cerebrosus]UNV87107.1 hypothetical protein MON37_10710 [Morococcus cerebrosus]